MNTPRRALRCVSRLWLFALAPACAQTISSASGDSTLDAGHDLGGPTLVDARTDAAASMEASVTADAFVPCDTPVCRQRAIELHAARESVMIQLADGRTLGWGHHDGRAMGVGDFHLGPRAVAVPAGSRLYVGQSLHCRIDSDHSLWCWGTDGYELLGTSPRYSRRGPETARRVMSEVRDVALSGAGLCALRLSGHVDCVGSDVGLAGEVTEPNIHIAEPIRAFGVSGVTKMSEGTRDTSTFCAFSDRATYCWGNGSRNLNWPTSSDRRPQLLPAWQGASRFVLGTCSLDLRGVLGCAGSQFVAVTGEMQSGGRPTAHTRVEMPGVPRMTDLTFGGSLCAVDVDGRVWCGGFNERGQVGVGSAERWVPFQLVPLGEAAEQVRCGQWFCCARTRSGQVWCWGDNREGQLGRPSTAMESSPSPVRVSWE